MYCSSRLLTRASNSDLGNEMVDIFAGKEGKRYTVHKDELISGSKYFALQPGLEGKNASIDMKAEDVGAVSLLVGFLYRRFIPAFEVYKLEANARKLAKNNSGFQSAPAVPFVTSTGLSIFQAPRPALVQAKSENRALSPFPLLSSQSGIVATQASKVSECSPKLSLCSK